MRDFWYFPSRVAVPIDYPMVRAADRQRACAHWAQHRRRFGSGRYAHELVFAEHRLGCR